MPAIEAQLHPLQLGKLAEGGTIRLASTPLAVKVPQADHQASCLWTSHVVSLCWHHQDSNNLRPQVSKQRGQISPNQIRCVSRSSTELPKHLSVHDKLQAPSSSFSGTRLTELDSGEHSHSRRRVLTLTQLDSLGHTKKQRHVSTHAVRVEDLSPAAPKPDEEEPVDIKVPVGFVGELSDTVFSVQKLLPQPSILLTVTLPKPLGIVFEESRIRKRVTVAELVAGGNAERLARVVQMFGSVTRSGPDGAPVRTEGAVQVGDVLRGLTTTQCIVDLFGVRAPRRATVYFDTRNRRWGEIMGAFGAVKLSDGEITLVLERRLERGQVQ